MRIRGALRARVALIIVALLGVATVVDPVEDVVTRAYGSTALQAGGIHKIKHVIVVMQENRSFDNYFGTYPGADGIPMRNGRPTVCVPDLRVGHCVRPYHDRASSTPEARTPRVRLSVDIDRGRDERLHPHGAAGTADIAGVPRCPRVHECARAPRPDPGRDRVARRSRDPELLGVRASFRVAGPHVRRAFDRGACPRTSTWSRAGARAARTRAIR